MAVGLGPNNGEPSEQESLIICDRLREQVPAAPILEPARGRALVVANLEPGQLARVTDRYPDSHTLAKYDDARFTQLIEKARSRAEGDLRLLLSGFGKLAQIVPFAEGAVAGVPPISCLVACSRSTLSRFAVSKKTLVNQLADQFLVLAETSPSAQCQIVSAPQDKSFVAWSTLFLGVMEACAQTVLIGMSLEASQLLLEYWREEMQQDPVRLAGQICWAQLGPLIAAKLALCFHLCLLRPKSQVSAEVMRDAIGMARWLVRISAQVKAMLSKEQQQLDLDRKAEHLLCRIPVHGAIGWRALRRRFNPQGIAIHQSALDYLLATGRIVRHADGSLQRATS